MNGGALGSSHCWVAGNAVPGTPGDAARCQEMLGDYGKYWEMLGNAGRWRCLEMPGEPGMSRDVPGDAPSPSARGTGPCLHLQLSPLQRHPQQNGAQRAELNCLPGITEASLIPSAQSHIKGFLVLLAEGTQSFFPVSLLRSHPSLCALALRSGSV